MKGSLTIGRVFGVRIEIHWTFMILVALIVFAAKSLEESGWVLAFTTTVFVCVVLHELGHALAARRFGIGTRSITLLPIGGIAQIDRIPEKPAQELAIAFAGPAVNLILALILFLPAKATLNAGLTKFMEAINGHNFIVNLFMVNVSLAVFNLIPAFPMDGGRVFRALLNLRMGRISATRVAARTGQVLAAGLLLLSLFSNQFVQTNPTLFFIAIFVFVAAQSELQGVLVSSLMENHQVGEITMHKFGKLSANDRVRDAVSMMLDSSDHDFVVFDGDTAVGTLGRNGLLRALSEKGPEASIRGVMNATLNTIESGLPLTDVLERLEKGNNDEPLLVTRQQSLEGIVNKDNLLEFILTRKAVQR